MSGRPLRGGVTASAAFADARPSSLLEIGDLSFHTVSGQVTRAGMPVPMGQQDRAVLRQLVLRHGSLVSIDHLRGVANCVGEELSAKGLEICVRRLSNRLGPTAPAIKQVRGVGYIFGAKSCSSRVG